MIAYKKFTTVYRQHMVKLKEELCSALLLRTHPLFQLVGTGNSDFESLLVPCPLKVCVIKLKLDIVHCNRV